MTVQNTIVYLDYTAFPEHNNDNGMLLGITRLTYDKSASPAISNVSWCSAGDNHFLDCKTDFVRKPSKLRAQSDETAIFEELLKDARHLTKEELQNLLPAPGFKPPQRIVTTTTYLRNPYVVTFALQRANGFCEKCHEGAPFISKSTGQPYLEVHHIQPLSKGGTDDVNNTWAVCPNCHRELHLGTAYD